MKPSPRRLQQLSRDEALRRLASVPLGRLVFTMAGLPAVRPVIHAVDDSGVLIRTHLASGTSRAAGSVVAYEADQIDLETHTGWSVIITGQARLVEDPVQVTQYEELVCSWMAQDATHILRIDAVVVTGFELVDDEYRPPAAA
jgi:nitroimidazol reductase NimA-like FMN-containing flavoprotein (pyridoxamine 5'-phosphate oxidase superfamily)